MANVVPFLMAFAAGYLTGALFLAWLLTREDRV